MRLNNSRLVVYLPLWKIRKSVGMIIPNTWKNKNCSKPPTKIYDIIIYNPSTHHLNRTWNWDVNCFALPGQAAPRPLGMPHHWQAAPVTVSHGAWLTRKMSRRHLHEPPPSMQGSATAALRLQGEGEKLLEGLHMGSTPGKERHHGWHVLQHSCT